MMKRDCLSQSQSTARTAITIMIEAIAASGLKEMPGITGSADEAAELFAKGQLKPNFEAKCNHHGEHHN